MNSPLRVVQTKLLLCEGKDEEQFFGALFKHLGRSDVQIAPVGGKHGFSKGLAAVVADPKFPHVTDLLVVRDADCASDGYGFTPTWTSVTTALQIRGLPIPTAHAQFIPGPPRVAIFIMPNGSDDGMLETLCRRSVELEPASACVVAYFDCLADAGVPSIPHLPRNADKAFMRVFLASLPEPDRKLGEAAQAGFISWTAPALSPLLALLNQL